MKQRARSTADKAELKELLLNEAEAQALTKGGVRFVLVTEVTARVGIHRTGARRYFESREELLLDLSERCWKRWVTRLEKLLKDRTGMVPTEVASHLASSMISDPVFCDLLTHAPLHLEGEVSLDRARRYKRATLEFFGQAKNLVVKASTLGPLKVEALLTTAVLIVAGLWQSAHPTKTLQELYRASPELAHFSTDLETQVEYFLKIQAIGLNAEE